MILLISGAAFGAVMLAVATAIVCSDKRQCKVLTDRDALTIGLAMMTLAALGNAALLASLLWQL